MYYEKKNPKWISPTICVTHACQLNCIYCYENKKDTHSKLSFDTAINIIENIFATASDEVDGIEFCFIGGEPLLEFDLIKNIVENYKSKRKEYNKEFIFSATTNGALLNDNMKRWFENNKDIMLLCLSLDGTKETHDHNRDNSFDKIDINFFLRNYPNQSVKMTLTDYSLPRLYENITYLHSLGFKRINGVNLYEGDFDFSKEEYIEILVPQLKKLVDFYSLEENRDLFNQIFDKRLELLESESRRHKKNCGIGSKGTCFYDVDGKKYPCVMCTPMTLSFEQLKKIETIDFDDESIFVDKRCNESCYIYPVCTNCSGSNYKRTDDFSKRDYTKCTIKKLEVLFCAELMARKIINHRDAFEDENILFHLIQAIKKIRNLYYPMFSKYIEGGENNAE